MAQMFQRPLVAAGMQCSPLSFGDDLKADLYYPAKPAAGQKLPLVLWLHPYAYATGYSRGSREPFAALVKRGFAVMAFDQIGFGTRVRDARDFYQRYPKWSLMGKMVADTRAAVDAAAALEMVDAERIYFAGYALGAKVGLMAAALEPRLKGGAVVAGVDPLRLDTAQSGTEGIRQYSHIHGLLPRLGFFVGHEDRLPVDFDEVLALVAPRPVLVVAPSLDRYARVEDVRREVDAARRVYERLGSTGSLRFETPVDFNRFPRERQEAVWAWLSEQARR
jgi:pimeloyl-ACP methyl ester carboxylesterase